MRVAEFRLRAAAAPVAVWRSRAKLLTSAAILLGWASLTWGVVGFFPTATVSIWRLAIGLLLISLSGWQFVAFIARKGLYTLTRGKDA